MNAACTHDPEQYVTSDEGTSYCPLCEIGAAAKDLMAMSTAAADQALAMTDRELGECLLGLNEKRWTTIEIHEAGRRLIGRG